MTKKAGAVSQETRERILQAAKDEFTQRGFQGSSLRRISAGAGVTTGAIYFFFEGKDDLFDAILSEITVPFARSMRDHYEAEHNYLEKKAEDNQEADIDVGMELIDFYFEKRQTWDILLGNQDHPSVKAFLDHFVDESTEHYLYLLELARKEDPKRAPVDPFAVHQFVHMQVDTMMNLVSHDFNKEEMKKHSRIVTKMLRAAFTALSTI